LADRVSHYLSSREGARDRCPDHGGPRREIPGLPREPEDQGTCAGRVRQLISCRILKTKGGVPMSASLSDPTMRLFVVCAAILVLKMSVTSLATAVFRNLRGVFISPEDYAFRRTPPRAPDAQIE